VTAGPALPARIGSIAIPGDSISRASWTWASAHLPAFVFSHSVRVYCWGAALAEREALAFDQQVLWVASLLHDVGLTRTARASR
jgi:HD superfamily phosphodiesterase